MELALQRLQSNPEDADALVVLGAWYFLQGRVQDALDCFHHVTRTDPTYPGIWHLKARAFEALGDRDSADQCRRRGEDSDP